MTSRRERAEQVRHRVQMLLGTFGTHGVLPLEFKPAFSVGDLLSQHLDNLGTETEAKGGIAQVLAGRFAKVYAKVYKVQTNASAFMRATAAA